MLHTSETLNWNAWEKILNQLLKVSTFFIPDGEKLRKIYVILIHRIEVVSISYENQNEKKRQINWMKLDWLLIVQRQTFSHFIAI